MGDPAPGLCGVGWGTGQRSGRMGLRCSSEKVSLGSSAPPCMMQPRMTGNPPPVPPGSRFFLEGHLCVKVLSQPQRQSLVTWTLQK